MRKNTQMLGWCLGAMLLAAPCPAVDDHHDRPPVSPFTLQPLAGHVYCLYGRGGNVGFFVGPKCVLLVDDQFKDLAPGIKAEVESVTALPIKFLVNTHHHGDHTGGNEFFSQFAEILAQDNVRRHMLASPGEILKDYPAARDSFQNLLASEADSTKRARYTRIVKSYSDQIDWAKTVKIKEIAPFLTFESEMRVYLGDETIRLIHPGPAHTDGDAVVVFTRANVVHMGDCYFNKVIPFIDWENGGSVPGYLKAIDAILEQVPANATFIPGHGKVSDAQGLRAFRKYLSDLADAVKVAHDRGMTLEQVKAGVTLPAYDQWEGYAQRFTSNLEAAWRSMY